MLKRSSGILLNISSLPCAYGIGGLGKEIDDFCDFSLACGFHYWQILPVTTIGLGNSPYSGVSAFAGNFLYIDPATLARQGYISEEDRRACEESTPYAVDYGKVIAAKSAMLKKAYDNVKDRIGDKLKDFEKTCPWVREYALFMSLKSSYGGAPWWNWQDCHKKMNEGAKRGYIDANADEYYYFVFEQYLFDVQWKDAKKRVNAKGMKFIGDMPMYVSMDSADVWGEPEAFLLDEILLPKKVAGVPPDYFSEEGQLWGNPLYDYDHMRKDGFSWWMKRFDRMAELYDVLRIDHFRAFSEYWAVDYGATTAKNGKWCEGVGEELFKKVFEKHDKDGFIAEDLGIIDEKVNNLLAKLGLPCMRVMQFGFEDGDSIHLPHNFSRNCVGYTATHDNNTTLGWMYGLKENILDYMLRYIECDRKDYGGGGYDCKATKIFIRRLISSCCRLAVVPFQDLCGYGGDCRMNTPGVADGNWTFRATSDAIARVDKGYFHYINCLYGRNNAIC